MKKNTENIKEHISERFHLDTDKSEIILSGNGSAGIIENALDVLPQPPSKSQLFVIGPSFPFILSAALSRRDRNRGIDLRGAEEQDTEKGSIYIDMKAQGIGTIFTNLGTRTQDTLPRVMARREQLPLKRPTIYYLCNPNTPQGDVVPFEAVREFSQFGAERGGCSIYR